VGLHAGVQVGIKLPENEMRELVFEMDEDNSGSISFKEFSQWWKEQFSTPLVELMHTEAELDQVFAEEMASNRLVVLEVGFTFCRPCRAFEEKYKALAREFPDARFLRCNGTILITAHMRAHEQSLPRWKFRTRNFLIFFCGVVLHLALAACLRGIISGRIVWSV
jgi:thiol-disulfide isomerase/thioredoxin